MNVRFFLRKDCKKSGIISTSQCEFRFAHNDTKFVRITFEQQSRQMIGPKKNWRKILQLCQTVSLYLTRQMRYSKQLPIEYDNLELRALNKKYQRRYFHIVVLC
jgi:hypothetical protein